MYRDSGTVAPGCWDISLAAVGVPWSPWLPAQVWLSPAGWKQPQRGSRPGRVYLGGRQRGDHMLARPGLGVAAAGSRARERCRAAPAALGAHGPGQREPAALRARWHRMMSYLQPPGRPLERFDGLSLIYW